MAVHNAALQLYQEAACSPAARSAENMLVVSLRVIASDCTDDQRAAA